MDVTDPNAGIKFNRHNIERDGGLYSSSPNHSSFLKSPKCFKSTMMIESVETINKK